MGLDLSAGQLDLAILRAQLDTFEVQFSDHGALLRGARRCARAGCRPAGSLHAVGAQGIAGSARPGPCFRRGVCQRPSIAAPPTRKSCGGLKTFPALRYRDVDQTGVTPEALADFRALRPEVRLPSDIWVGIGRGLNQDRYRCGCAARISSARPWAASILTSSPLPMPGHQDPVLCHALRSSINSGQYGKLRHCMGLAR